MALPDQLFYNTGIHTYVWIATNRKQPERKGRVQLINAVEFYVKMKKSLGNKRNEVSDDNIEKIIRLYGEFTENDYSKIFDNADFGYQRITIERPLKLNFQASAERIQALKQEKAFRNLATSKKKVEAAQEEISRGKALQDLIIKTLSKLDPETIYKNREEYTKLLKKQFKTAGADVSASLFKTILKALSCRDETAEVCIKKGESEPDPELRDYENVPLKEDIYNYFAREVAPHVPDAWIDETKTKTGYEINFTKEFYRYTPLRSLEQIRADILALEEEMEGLLKEAVE